MKYQLRGAFSLLASSLLFMGPPIGAQPEAAETSEEPRAVPVVEAAPSGTVKPAAPAAPTARAQPGAPQADSPVAPPRAEPKAVTSAEPNPAQTRSDPRAGSPAEEELFGESLWGVEEEISAAMQDLSLVALMDLNVVSASKASERLADAPSNIEIVTASQIKEWGARDIKDVLRRLAGFPVVADRDEWVFAVRGNVSDNNLKYLILIDGHRVNSIENFGPGQIIELPNDLSNVKRLEIIRGPGSAVWGSDALAGVINIVTKTVDDLDGKSAHVQGTVGMDGMYRLNAQVGRRLGSDAEVMLMAAYARQRGRIVTQSAATEFPVLEQATDFSDHPFGTYRTALERRRPGFMLHAKARVGELSISAFHFNTQVHNRHFEADRGRKNNLATDKNFVEGAYSHLFESGLVLAGKLWAGENRSEYQPFAQGGQAQLPANIVWLDRGGGASLDVSGPLFEFLDLNSGVDFLFTRLGPNQRINGIDPSQPQNETTGFWFDPYLEDEQLGAYAIASLHLPANLKLVGGTRVDHNSDRGDDEFNVNPRASLIYQPAPTTSLKVIYNRGFLRPANFQSATAKVESETMDQVEAIWLQQVSDVNISTTLFWQRLNGFINILPGNVRDFANAGDYESRGVEAAVSTILKEGHSIWINGSYTQAKGTGMPDSLPVNSQRILPNGKLLSFPEITANLGATVRLLERKIFITPMLRFYGETDFRATPPVIENPNAGDAGEPQYLAGSLADATHDRTGPFLYLDLSLGYEPNDTLGFYVYGDNLLDERAEQHLSIWNGTVGQYGRYIEGRIQTRF